MESEQQVEVVVFNGATYRRYPNAKKPNHRRYFMRAGGRRMLHRDIWEFLNGPIPDGYDIHHKDGDPSNNDPDNLEPILRSEHRRHHSEQNRGKCSDAQREHLERVRDRASQWHRSTEGRAWHEQNTKKHFQHGGAAQTALRAAREEVRKNPYKNTCVVCGVVFDAFTRKTQFCSNTCVHRKRRADRRAQGGVQSPS